jgi:acylphosphatase
LGNDENQSTCDCKWQSTRRFFRVATKKEAAVLGVKGVVRNLPDGKMDAVFEGEEDVVNMLIGFVKHGSPRTKVSKFDLTWETYTGEFSAFRIKSK